MTNSSLFETRVPGRGISYFIDLRRAVNGRLYLSLTESRRKESGFEQSRVIIFEECLGNFLQQLGEASAVADGHLASRPDDQPDQNVPNAFQRWTEEEEATLVRHIEASDSLEEIASVLGRSVRAIEARIEKLGIAVG